MSADNTTVLNARPSSSADRVAWDLSDLYSGVDDPNIGRDLDTALKRAQAFESTYRGKINVPGGPPTDALLAAVRELENVLEDLAFRGR